jgi:glycosyltransferase involved in cell wall biosynthesis
LSPLVTAVVPSYNYARYVVRAVESCLAQTHKDLEVVVVDDASTDGSQAVLRERFASEPRVRLLLFDENKGVSGNFNRGLAEARGRYVGFCCADDEWSPEHAATLVPALESSSGVALAYARARQLGGSGEAVDPEEAIYFDSCPDAEFWERLVRGVNFVPFVGTLFRRDLALEVGGFREDVRVIQDYALWLRLAARHEVRFVDRETVIVRWHSDNASARGAKTSERRRRDMVHIFEDLLARESELLRARGLERVARRRLVGSLLRLARRAPTAAEARACCARAIELEPLALAPYLNWVRALVSGGK